MKYIILLFTFFFSFINFSQVNFGNGSDGTPVIGVNTIVNSYKKIQGTAGSLFTLINNTSFSLSAGNVVLVINMVSGEHELRNVVSVSGLAIDLGTGSIANSTFAANSQMIKVPQYSSLTVNAGNSITCPSWDGESGGVVCFLVLNTMSLIGGEIDASGKGFFGGAGGAGGIGGAGGLGGFSGSSTSPTGGLTGFGGSGFGGAGWGGGSGYSGSNGLQGTLAYYSGTSTFLPCGNTIASCNNTNTINPTTKLYMGDGGSGGTGGNGKSGAGGGGSKCNQPGINGGTGGGGGNGGNGGRGGGIILIKAGNITHNNTLIKSMGLSGLPGASGTNGGNGGNGTCGGGGGDGADGGNGGQGGHGGAGGSIKITKGSGGINSSLVNKSGGAAVTGGSGGPGGLGGLNSTNNSGVCSCGINIDCSFPILIPYLNHPNTTVNVDSIGNTHFLFNLGDSTIDLTYYNSPSCNGYFMGFLYGTLIEAGSPIASYLAPIASLSNNILLSLINFVNNNPTNLDSSGQSILTSFYHLIEGCSVCSQCNGGVVLPDDGLPGSSGPISSPGGIGYFIEDVECVAPIASAPNLSICSGGSMMLTPTSNQPNTSYSWTLQNGSVMVNGPLSGSGTTIGPLLNFSNSPGTVIYSVTPYSASNCPGAPFLVTVTVIPYPQIALIPNQSLCSNETTLPVQIVTSIPSFVTWFSNSSSSNLSGAQPNGVSNMIPPQTLINTGSSTSYVQYNIYASSIFSSLGCVSMATYQVEVKPIPTMTINLIDDTICSATALNAILSSNIPLTTFNWSFSSNASISGMSNGTGNTINQVLTNSSNQIQTLTYSVTSTANGCSSNSSNIIVNVNPLPIVSAGNDTSLCGPSLFTLNGSGAMNYSWDNNLTNGVPFTISTTTTFTVQGVDLNGCQNSDQVTVTIQPLPTVDAGPDQTVCLGDSLSFTATSNGTGVVYSWSNNMLNGAYFTPSTTTMLTVTATDVNSCLNTDQVLAIVNSLPTIDAGPDQTVCLGDSLSFTATSNGTGVVYSWSNNMLNGAYFTPSTTTTLTVTATDVNSCSNTDQVLAIVNSLPTIDAGPDQTACLGDSLSFTATSSGSGVIYSWSNSMLNGAFISPSSTTTLTVTATDVNSCTNTDQVLAIVNPLPTIDAGPDQIICIGQAIVLNASSNGSIVWDGIVVNNTPFTPLTTATYNVTATSAEGCVNSDEILVTVGENPDANFYTQTPTQYAPNSTFDFVNYSSGAVSYEWDFGDLIGTSSQEDPSYTYPPLISGTYFVTLVVSSALGCKDSITSVVQLINNSPGVNVIIPTGFSPNNDSDNDDWTIYGIENYPNSKILVFNRWGLKVFEGNEFSPTWNGVYQGEILPTADYYYIVELSDGRKFNGVVTIKQ
jgi:gliding motility-associated-like protein